MRRYKILRRVISVFAACLAYGAHADGKPPAPNAHQQGKKMRMDEPMSTGMMKKGMKKGDVKRMAEKKSQAMQPLMEQEEKSVSRIKSKP